MQGTYVEGIKEEVVLSPGHALSFIAAGEGICHSVSVENTSSLLVSILTRSMKPILTFTGEKLALKLHPNIFFIVLMLFCL